MKHGIAGIVLCGFLACGDGKLATIEFSETAEADIPSGGLFSNVTEFFQSVGFANFADMDISQSEELVNQGVAPGDITTAYLTHFSLSVLQPEDGDLSFLSSLEIWVEADGLEPVMVASQTDFPDGEMIVDFVIEDVNIVDFVISDSMTITTEASGSLPSQDTKIEAEVGFEVGVTAQGACNAISNSK